MIALKEFCRYLDTLLCSIPVTDSCVNGLQVEGGKEISKMATAVSASLETIKEAVDLGVEVLIVHHGLFWNGDSPVVAGSKRVKLNLLLQNNVSLLAYHLPLDMHPEFGNNWKAARDLGWTNLEPFGIYKGMAIGVKGNIPAQSRDQFKKQLEKYYGHEAHSAFGGKEEVSTAALISGGAHRSLIDAAVANVDCYITGSFDEPTWNQAYEEGINFFALGHSATERIGPKALGDHLHQHFSLGYQFIDIPNPF